MQSQFDLAFRKLKAEKDKSERQIEYLIRDNNQLKRARDVAQQEAGRLLLILQDIAFGPADKAREIAIKAIGEDKTPTATPKKRTSRRRHEVEGPADRV